jgi:hypothetical protein
MNEFPLELSAGRLVNKEVHLQILKKLQAGKMRILHDQVRFFICENT